MPPDREIVIAVLTYRRPAGLGSVLRELVEHIRTSEHQATILVVDNDDEPSAHRVVQDHLGVRYVHEPRPGIVAARNRALAEAGSARLLIFIDDDERPCPGWMDSLVSTWKESHPAAVVGPVLPEFLESPTDPWITAGGYFDRPRFPTGTTRPAAGTGNLLLDLDTVRSLGLRFDDRFTSSGGSDTYFTQTLTRGGGRIVWCDEASVFDVVPPERMTRTWVLQRARRMGNSRSRAAVMTSSPGLERGLTRLRLAAQAVLRVVVGGGRYALGRALSSDVHQALGARTFARGCGMFRGAVGGIVIGYSRHKTPDPLAPDESSSTVCRSW